MESAKLIREFRPNVMIGVGGYASGPAMLTAAMMSVPTIAFEPNVVPGFANRMVAPMVSAATVHFEATCHYFRNCYVTGVRCGRSSSMFQRVLGMPAQLCWCSEAVKAHTPSTRACWTLCQN